MNKNKKILEEVRENNKINKENSEVNIKQKEGTKLLIIAVLVTLIVLSIGILIGYTISERKTINTDEQVVDTVTDESSGMEVNLVEKNLTDKEITEAKDALYNTLEYIKNNNGYIQCRTGDGEDDYITYMYNKNGEVFRQNQNEVTIFKNDGNCVVIDDYLVETKDADIITIAEKVLEAVTDKDKTSNIDFKQIETKTDNLGVELNSTDDLGYKAYVINIKSYEEIEKIYNKLGIEEYTEEVITELKELYGEENNPELRYYFTISDDPEINEEENKYPDFSFSCRIVYEEEEYTQWSVEGYLLVNDWKLSEDWYTSDFSNEEEIVTMLTELSTEIENMFKEFAEQYDLDINDLIETTESLEETTESLEETTESLEETTESLEE